MYSFAANYKLPLLYPEYSLGGLVYFRRIDASFFVDYAHIKRHIYENNKIAGSSTKKISSYGIEINSDVNYLRFYAPANIGVRMIWIPETRNVYFNLLYSINFTSL